MTRSRPALAPSTRKSTLLELEITPRADADLLDIWMYTAETWSFHQADRYIDSLHGAFETLRAMPEIAREHVELERPIRIYLSGEHLIAYRVYARRLIVVRVLGQRQDWLAALKGP